ncbi:acyltransferase [Escherichia fergusonii]|uniref:acyltransferase family protein n=1 Tax=Escherichia fergusonii TaxID=564 RepID=UPI000CF324F6|nr:acyltransferase [Escherichia fergusonii]MCP9680035.1 acyltransferase [Escherichia fergusonii]MCP9698268.1 acyltransferase [Escherichia fergusonii]PQI94331.1 acyltransferase [Escherichia fergusonii]QME72955.1 acyltransferase [Escherichia fergusonii]QME84911.1 acyltransferase [Escherichia fergusonii]
MNTVDFVIEKGNNNLDLVRIVLAISVIYGHGYFVVDNHGSKEIINQLYPFTYSGALAVKVFFFISGMLVTNSLLKGSTPTTFVISRFFRIVPAFFVTTFATAFIIGPLITTFDISEYFPSDMLIEYIKSNPLTGVSYKLPGVFESNHLPYVVNGSLWTIPYEVRAYIGLLAAYMVLGSGQKKIATLLCIFVILIPVLNLNKETFINIPNKDSKLVISCFALGVMYAINKDRIHVSWHIPVGLFILHYFFNNSMLSETLFFFSACTLLLWFSSIKIIRNINIKHDISYGVYLWGFLVQQLVARYAEGYGVFVNQLISIVISVILGYLSFVFIERPCISFGSKVKSQVNNISLVGIRT